MKRKLSIFLITTLCCKAVTAQNQNEVVKAELSFASAAREYTMKKAFLQYMDSTAVVFNEGNIQNGIGFWSKAPDTEGKLLWRPVFYGISSSGDLGFTTGPWEFRPTMNDSVRGAGQYTTIWSKNAKGEWKFLVDMGVTFRQSLFDSGSLTVAPALKRSDNTSDTTLKNLERQFLSAFELNRQSAVQNFLHSNAWLNIDGRHPIQNASSILPIMEKLPSELCFEPVAHALSSAGDLGYVYGTIHYVNRKENYLRIWGHTNEGWKILLQVIKQ